MLESLVLWISKHEGVTKAPLGYCLQTEHLAPPTAPDYRYGHADSIYSSHEAEMFARTPHFEDFRALPFGSDFSTDNTKVWDLISKTFKSHPAWTVVRPFQKVKDGRGAYFALYKHYLGSSSVDNMSTSAENNLKNAAYTGESKKFNFDKYARIHMEQHHILRDLTEHGYAGIDERSKVRHLMAGIKCAALDSVKNTILASAALRVDFTGCVDLYKSFIHQSSTESEEQSLMIAKIETEGGEGGGRYKGRRGGARGGK